MDVHQNAKTTPHGRRLMIERLAEGWTVARVAAAAGVTAKTVGKWRGRHAQEGEAGLADRSSRPHASPSRLPDAVVAEILALRRQRLSGPAIARRLGRPISTVGLVLRRHRLARLHLLDPKPEIVRYQRDRPGKLIHLDIKKLGRIGGVGHRITGDRRGQKKEIGWEFLHVCVDDASRLAYTEILPDERKESAVAFLERAIAWFASLGVTVERVMTDNGSAYRSHAFRASLPGRPREAQAHQALHATDQRQGRALHSDQLARMGLSASLPHLRRAHRRHAPLAPWLQPTPTPFSPWRQASLHPPAQGHPPW